MNFYGYCSGNPVMFTQHAGIQGTVTLKRGSRGEDVKRVQRFLGIQDDGSFGPVTEAAVISYQRGNGLQPDGRVGPATRAKMNGSATLSNSSPKTPKTNTIPTNEPSKVPVVSNVLSSGAKGVYPFSDWSISSKYGIPRNNTSGRHTGVDFSKNNALGEDIYACFSGILVKAAKDGVDGSEKNYGNYVIYRCKLNDGNEYNVMYAHMTDESYAIYSKKMTVTAGSTLIGYIGTTGHSTGPHLHLEVRKSNWGTDVDPMKFF